MANSRAAMTSFCHQVLWPCLHYAVPDAPKTKFFYGSVSFKQYRSLNQHIADVMSRTTTKATSGAPGADLVGFQTANYARHLRQTMSRMLVYESLPKSIQVEVHVAPVSTGGEAEKEWRESSEGKKTKEKGRFVDVGVFPMGIDVNSLREKKRNPKVEYWVQLLRQRYAGMKLIVGRDKVDEI
ncbi:hypothetical protein EDD16DRAFT_1731632 [Pisolithus croceorrhizus]|nr:hypothetical protein EDD16DRAFT_1731632 [Pisolithus croceorrhizus]KAI6107714.1 hypothetical protein EV401DRAFT_2213071 [Pisolithus croceorrhizus]